MTFDQELHHLIGRYFRNAGASVSEILLILISHLTMIIQSCILSMEKKIQIANELIDIMKSEIEKDPHPMARRLN